ncbi:MAG TPA: hypothetical protein VNP04_07345 [Alphaproteobacteria bacterium]|nr:hypothetical protein [Alphaproteobacteria bacterium]
MGIQPDRIFLVLPLNAPSLHDMEEIQEKALSIYLLKARNALALQSPEQLSTREPSFWALLGHGFQFFQDVLVAIIERSLENVDLSEIEQCRIIAERLEVFAILPDI